MITEVLVVPDGQSVASCKGPGIKGTWGATANEAFMAWMDHVRGKHDATPYVLLAERDNAIFVGLGYRKAPPTSKGTGGEKKIFTLPVDVAAKIEECAEARGAHQSAVVTEALRTFFEAEAPGAAPLPPGHHAVTIDGEPFVLVPRAEYAANYFADDVLTRYGGYDPRQPPNSEGHRLLYAAMKRERRDAHQAAEYAGLGRVEFMPVFDGKRPAKGRPIMALHNAFKIPFEAWDETPKR